MTHAEIYIAQREYAEREYQLANRTAWQAWSPLVWAALVCVGAVACAWLAFVALAGVLR